jgi:hypothetical protein
MIHSRLISPFRAVFAVLIFCTLSLAQSAQQSFDTAYWAHQPPAVAQLNTMTVDVENPTASGRTSTGMSLAAQGYTIDVPIMVWGWDAYLTMEMRVQYGYTWVPSALMSPVTMAPGVTVPGQASYDPNNPPAGAITVSLNLANYPPYAPPPVAVPVVTPTSCVGMSLGAGYYQALTGSNCTLTNGQLYTQDPRGNFIFHQASPTPFNPNGARWFNPAVN